MIYQREKKIFNIDYHLILIAISILLSSYGIIKNEVAIYTIKKNPDLSVGEIPQKICHFGLKSIIDGNALSSYFEPSLFEYLKDNPTILNLSSDDKIINLIYRDDSCLVVVGNEEVLRGFILPLQKSMKFPLYYQISTIKEDDVSSIKTQIKNSNEVEK